MPGLKLNHVSKRGHWSYGYFTCHVPADHRNCALYISIFIKIPRETNASFYTYSILGIQCFNLDLTRTNNWPAQFGNISGYFSKNLLTKKIKCMTSSYRYLNKQLKEMDVAWYEWIEREATADQGCCAYRTSFRKSSWTQISRNLVWT